MSSFAEQLAARAAKNRRSASSHVVTESLHQRATASPRDQKRKQESVAVAAPAATEEPSKRTVSQQLMIAPATHANEPAHAAHTGDGDAEDGRMAPGSPTSLASSSSRRVSFEPANDEAQQRRRKTRDGTGGDRKYDKLKSENKKLRMEALLLKAKLELSQDEHDGASSHATDHGALARENEELRDGTLDLQKQCQALEIQLKGEEMLRQQLTRTECELAEITESKNTEIEVLRKQLDRVEQNTPRTGEEQTIDSGWSRERTGLRDEVRRLSTELLRHKEKEEEDEGISYSRYNMSGDNLLIASQHSQETDAANLASLQSIIYMMRQTIDQTNQEKELLERRLAAEQERSQMELHSFSKTLAGVDDLRKSAEVMSREIRRIKVKGYRPKRSELWGGGAAARTAGGGLRFGDLTAAVEASESMEDAIRLIEGHGDAVEERRRMGVVTSTAATAAEASASTRMDSGGDGRRGGGLGVGGFSPIAEDRGGFLSFWNTAGSKDDSDEEEEDGHRDKKKTEKKSRQKQKKSRDASGSVLTSFF